jgi:hypothetical protein
MPVAEIHTGNHVVPTFTQIAYLERFPVDGQMAIVINQIDRIPCIARDLDVGVETISLIVRCHTDVIIRSQCTSTIY